MIEDSPGAMLSGWWHPDLDDPSEPNWPPVDLKASKLSEAVILRADRSMRRILHPGDMIVVFSDPQPGHLPDPLPTHRVAVPEGQRRVITLPYPDALISVADGAC